jgi:hypothetical protein
MRSRCLLKVGGFDFFNFPCLPLPFTEAVTFYPPTGTELDGGESLFRLWLTDVYC